MFRLAHVTDPHFRTPRGVPGVSAAELLGKRAVGYLNLTVNRVRKHKLDLLEDMRVDLRAQAPDHLALTGDLSNIALGSEWRSALAWLDLSGVAPDAISVIPGNHDAYVPEVLATREFERLFAPYQTSDLDRDGESAYYPFVQIREPLALIGVSSAVATGDLGAWGRIGEAQLARLEAILTAPEVRALTGVELVLHGHDHHDERAELPGPDGRKIPIIGAGSASYAGGPERRARYSIYEFEEGGPPGGPITWVSRVHDEATSFFREARREALVP